MTAMAATVIAVPSPMTKVAAMPAQNNPCASANTNTRIAPEQGLTPTVKIAAKPRRQHHAGVLGSGSNLVTVPMQGTIVKVSVEVGQAIEVGETVVILEAMKMENSVAAEKSGVVKSIRVTSGDSVGAGDVVAEIE